MINPFWYQSTPGGDPDFASVVLLLHCDGTNGSTTFTDSSNSAKTLTAVGNAQVSTSNPKFGTGAMLLDGTGDHVTIPPSADFNFGTGNFTIEFFVRFNSAIRQYMSDMDPQNTSVIAITPSSGVVEVYSQGSHAINTGSAAFNTAQWYHIALVRNVGTWSIYRDGTLYAQATGQTSRTFGATSTFFIGQSAYGSFVANAQFDEWRITKGVARTITVPTEAYPDS